MAEQKEKSLEQELTQLKEIVKQLSDPELPLDDSVKLFEEGIALAASTEKRINELELKVQMLSQEEIENG